jgi:hypothetical protein
MMISHLIILGRHSITNHLKSVSTVALRTVVNINLFPSASTNADHLRKERLYTRVYLIVYSNTLCLLLFYSGAIERKIIKTHHLTSIADYEHLYEQESGKIKCPCEHISIPYNDFVTELCVQSFHQACLPTFFQTILALGEAH